MKAIAWQQVLGKADFQREISTLARWGYVQKK